MIYMYFDIRFQMVVIFSIYLEQIWFLIYLFQRYKKGRNPLIPRGLRPFLRKLEIGLEPTTPSLRVFWHSPTNAHFKPFFKKKIKFDYFLTTFLKRKKFSILLTIFFFQVLI